VKRLSNELLLAAAERGLIRVAVSKVARAAGCSEHTVHVWLKGQTVSRASDEAIRRALGETPKPEADQAA
jgi:transposase-like protein